MSNGRGLAECLFGLAQVAAARGRAEPAARLLGAAGALRESLAMSLSSAEQAAEEHAGDAARDALGEKAFARALAEGQTMSPDQAVSVARDG